jgi:hypothetical protein
MRHLLLYIIAALFLISGCGIVSSSDEKNFDTFFIETDRETYSTDEPIRVTLQNKTLHEVAYSRCGTVLERLNEDGEWISSNGIICPGIIIPPEIIEPGESTTTGFNWFSDDAEEGRYRIAFSLSDSDRQPLPREKTVTDTIIYQK